MTKLVFPDFSKHKISKKQAEIYNHKGTKFFINGGRMAGKDHIPLLKAFQKCFELYAQRCADKTFNRDGAKVIMIFLSPTETNCKDLWDRSLAFLPVIPGIAKNQKKNFHVKIDDRRIEIFGGEITITFETTTRKDTLRSRGCDILYINEGSYHARHTLIDVIFPCCNRSGYAGIIFISSSPKYLGHWWDSAVSDLRNKTGYFYDLGFKLFEITLYDNPVTTENEVNILKATKKANIYSARRELLGWINIPQVSEELLNSGESFAFDAHLILKTKINEPVVPQQPYTIGIDLATTGNDHLGVCIADRNGLIVRLERHSKTSYEDVIKLLNRLQEQFRPKAIVYDNNMNLLKNIESGIFAKMPLKPKNMTNKLKAQMVENFRYHLLMAGATLKIPNPELYFKYVQSDYQYFQENLYRLLKELHEYRQFEMIQEYQTKGRIESRAHVAYHKGADGTDDLLDATMMCFSEIPVPYKIAQQMEILLKDSVPVSEIKAEPLSTDNSDSYQEQKPIIRQKNFFNRSGGNSRFR